MRGNEEIEVGSSAQFDAPCRAHPAKSSIAVRLKLSLSHLLQSDGNKQVPPIIWVCLTLKTTVMGSILRWQLKELSAR